MSKHAKYSPSKLPRIIKCPGSVNLIKELKEKGLIITQNKSNTAAQEGTMLHAVMEEALTRGFLQVSAEQVLKYELTAEHVDACNECLDYIQVLKMSIPEGESYVEYIEEKVSLESYWGHYNCSELTDVYGTVDYALTYKGHLIIIDWKFGKGIEVWPDSAQLKAYALAQLSTINRPNKVTIIVGQPRIPGQHFKVFEIDVKDLWFWCENTLVPALKSINSNNPVFCPGEDTCRWCPVAQVPHACDARFKAVQEVTSAAFNACVQDPFKDNLDQSLELLKKAPIVDKYFKDLKVYVTSRLKQGKEVPGYKMVRGRSTRVFKSLDQNKVPTDFLKWVEEALGYDAAEFFINKPMSAPQAEKFLTKKVLKGHSEFYDFIHKPEGKLTLTTESDPREAVDFKSTSEVFSSFAKIPDEK